MKRIDEGRLRAFALVLFLLVLLITILGLVAVWLRNAEALPWVVSLSGALLLGSVAVQFLVSGMRRDALRINPHRETPKDSGAYAAAPGPAFEPPAP